jgi:hypothetical protein
MRALEPIVRKDPESWLSEIESWLEDDNKWVNRAGATVLGRLPMKYSNLTERCLSMLPPLFSNTDKDVQRAVSFAIRLSARGDIPAVRSFLEKHIPPQDSSATWVLCDVVRSMTKKFLPEFTSLVKNYQTWASDPTLNPKDLKSINSAIRILERS